MVRQGQGCKGSAMCRAEGTSPAGVLGDICGCFGAARKGQHRPPGAVLSQAAGNTDPGHAVAGAGGIPNSLLASHSALIARRARSAAWHLLRRARASWARLIVAACPCCQDLDVPWSTALARMVQAYHTTFSSIIAPRKIISVAGPRISQGHSRPGLEGLHGLAART